MSQKIVILTEGHSEPHAGKTAASVLRYRGQDVLALLDSEQAGKVSKELLGVGEAPVISQLSEAPDANTLLLGIAPPGGKIPHSWRPVLLEALGKGMDIISGLHDFLNDDPELAAAAELSGAKLVDIRAQGRGFKTIARRRGLDEKCFRVHTVGHDCSVGKMVTSIELTRGLQERGRKAKFLATGQTGIMVSGDGLPLDCIVADFVSGAAESLVLEAQQDHEIVLVEGQGSLVHPSYSGVTLSLLHGCLPHAMVLCYEVGRERITGVEQVLIPPLSAIRDLYETMAGLYQRSAVVGVAMNSRRISADEAERERERVREELGLPVCDIFRHGPQELLDAVEQSYSQHLRDDT